MNNTLAMGRFSLRFDDANTEAQFHVWHRERNLSLSFLGFATGLGGWLIAFAGGWLWLPDMMKAGSPVWLSVTGALSLLAALAVFSFASRPYLWLIWAVSLMTSHSGQIVLTLQLAVPALEMGQALAGCGLMVIIAALFPAFIQMPLRWAALTNVPGMTAFLWLSIGAYQSGEIDKLMVGVQFHCTVFTYAVVCAICALNERSSRQIFVKDRVIQGQHTKLENSARVVRRYVPPSVAEHIFAGDEHKVDSPQRQRVTILFSDIVGFTDMADRLDAESLTQVINEYMAAMTGIVDIHGGTLNEFSGDGLMAVFGAPNEMAPEDQVRQAVEAGQDMQAKLPALNEQWLKLGIGEPLQIRIGINTGVLSVGSFGSEGRMTYTAIGLQTNIASRIQSHCEPGGVLLSDTSWHLVKDQVDCEPKGEVECKGVHFPVKVYAPLAAEMGKQDD